MALDKAAYDQRGTRFELDDLRWAWDNYFIPNINSGEPAALR
jgi:hypothetical protein